MKLSRFARTYPNYHPRKRDPTLFHEKLHAGLLKVAPDAKLLYPLELDFKWDEFTNCDLPKYTTIREGNRFKPGDMMKAQMWIGRPYWSSLVTIAELRVVKTWDFEVKVIGAGSVWYVSKQPVAGYGFEDQQWENLDLIERIAKNDGLALDDFLAWFRHPRPFSGQIICWNESIDY